MEILSILLILLGLWLVWGFLGPYLKARSLRGQPAPSLSGADNQGLEGDALIYFWSPACGICVGMSRVVDRLIAGGADIVKVNILENMELARRYRVAATPTLVRIRNGTVEQVLLGAQSERKIRALLD